MAEIVTYIFLNLALYWILSLFLQRSNYESELYNLHCGILRKTWFLFTPSWASNYKQKLAKRELNHEIMLSKPAIGYYSTTQQYQIQSQILQYLTISAIFSTLANLVHTSSSPLNWPNTSIVVLKRALTVHMFNWFAKNTLE